jgi:hypothetical protein
VARAAAGGAKRSVIEQPAAHRLSGAFAARIEQGQRPTSAGNAASTARFLDQLSELVGTEAVAQRDIADRYGMQRIQGGRQIDHRAGQAGDPEAVDLHNVAVREQSAVQVDIAPHLPLTLAIVGQMNPLELLVPDRQSV